MNREIHRATYFDSAAPVELSPTSAWDFDTDLDIKQQNPINATAQEEFDYSIQLNTTPNISAGYAIAITQEAAELRSDQSGIAWCVQGNGAIETTQPMVVLPFVAEENNGSDMDRFQFLPLCQEQQSGERYTFNFHHTVVRRRGDYYKGASSTTEAYPLVFGYLFYNMSSSAGTLNGMVHLSASPNNKKFTCSVMGI